MTEEFSTNIEDYPETEQSNWLTNTGNAPADNLLVKVAYGAPHPPRHPEIG